jgi:hypothetical protein
VSPDFFAAYQDFVEAENIAMNVVFFPTVESVQTLRVSETLRVFQTGDPLCKPG